jgi:predicted CopG family antitoxin
MSKNIQIRDDLYDYLFVLKGGKEEGNKSFSEALDLIKNAAQMSEELSRTNNLLLKEIERLKNEDILKKQDEEKRQNEELKRKNSDLSRELDELKGSRSNSFLSGIIKRG